MPEALRPFMLGIDFIPFRKVGWGVPVKLRWECSSCDIYLWMEWWLSSFPSGGLEGLVRICSCALKRHGSQARMRLAWVFVGSSACGFRAHARFLLAIRSGERMNEL